MIFLSKTCLGRHAQRPTPHRLSMVRPAPLPSAPILTLFFASDQIVEGVIDLDPHYQRGA
jgi:hypothetical protein